METIKRGKKAVSALIATVLLVLITIAAAGIVYQMVIPMLKISAKVTECPKYELTVNTDYSWYNSSVTSSELAAGSKNVQVGIDAGSDVVKANLKDIQIKVRYGGKSETFYVTDALATGGVKTEPNTLIGAGESQSYKLNTTTIIPSGTAVSVNIAAVIKPTGEKTATCDMSAPVAIAEVSELE